MFNQDQIQAWSVTSYFIDLVEFVQKLVTLCGHSQEFKEAFNMIDQNRDGFIDKEDLHDMLASLGKDPTDEYLEG